MIILVAILSVAMALAAVFAAVSHRDATTARAHLADRQAQVEQLTSKLEAQAGALQALEIEKATLAERMAAQKREAELADAAREEHFRRLAGEIFKEHSAAFSATSQERLNQLLTPLKNDLDGFREIVKKSYDNEARERFSLQSEVRRLIELNSSLGQEAKELTRALKGDSKVQGDWGEMILERLLEMSGLRKGVHFATQATTNTDGSPLGGDDGRRLRPDVVVFYPDERCVVVDSKVSLSAYMDYVSASPDSPQAREAAKRHIASVRRHVAELADKRYQDLVGEKRLDFVVMFVPNEGAYFAMMRLEPGIWEEAYAKRVLISSPTHLIAILRMLEQLWKQDTINKNVMEIARLSGTMLDKFVKFTEDLDSIDKHLAQATAAYTQARRKLADGPGNMCVTARKILNLGAKSTKPAAVNRLAGESDQALGECDITNAN